ncbi:hypothetical protein [Streptomyces halobius]|uniref:Uncharacterized protein n=1 Tax=Streptomyces halobius TaxID=2879846 RepID=A0ABY4MI47_9ACTN|nr:hypothetical protein [Streptomyces halobius]UQA97476.1 hypothetical protein K9S39_41535 [Streptomyces halobius]
MTTRAPQEQKDTTTYPPGTYVYDVVADAVGRVADPEAYPAELLGRAATLVVPIGTDGEAWQAEPGALRLATAAEIEAAR